MLDLVELDIGFEEFETTNLWAPEFDRAMWDGLDSWLGQEGCEVLE